MTPFEVWMQELDQICWAEIGLSIHDLPDMPFRDRFDAGLTPAEFLSEELIVA